MYVMDLCSQQERDELDALRKMHPSIEDAITEFEMQLENKLMQDAIVPGHLIDTKIINSIKQNNKVNFTATKSNSNKIIWLQSVAAAAILLLLISSVFNYFLYKKSSQQQILLAKQNIPIVPTLPVSDYNILKQPTITPVAMYGVAPHSICRCTMFWDKPTGKAYIMIHHLPTASGYNYQLWALVNGKPQSIGVINDAIRDRFIEISNVPANATAFTVTLEKLGGSPSPSVDETYLSGHI